MVIRQGVVNGARVVCVCGEERVQGPAVAALSLISTGQQVQPPALLGSSAASEVAVIA